MSTVTAIAIIAPNAVTATAIVIGWKQHGKGLEAQRDLADASLAHERMLADLDSARDVLADAAVTLHRVGYALDEVKVRLGELGPSFLQQPRGVEAYSEFRDAGREFDLWAMQLQLRLGASEATVQAFLAANAAFLAIWRSVRRLRLVEESSDDDAVQQRRHVLSREVISEVGLSARTFEARQSEFMRSGGELAAARLRRADA